MVIGKSGSNELHGSLFEFFRNEALNARNLFAQPGPKPEFRRNQYGADARRSDSSQQDVFLRGLAGHADCEPALRASASFPPAAQRQGIFTQAIFDPLTSPRTQFPNNTIPANRLDALGLQILQHYPLPNVAGANNFVRTATEPDTQDQADFRLDRYFGEKHRIFGRYTYFRDDDNPVTPLPDGSGSLTSGVIGHAITRGDAFVGDYNWTPSAYDSQPVPRRLFPARPQSESLFRMAGSRYRACPQTRLARCCRSSRSPDSSRLARPPPRIRISRPPSQSFSIPLRWCVDGTPSNSGPTSAAKPWTF